MLKFFRIPFATSGDKTAVPDAVDVNGFVSYTAGYGFDYQRQKTDPAAKNIERDKMNEIFFDITTAIAELQAQGVPDFITSALNGGTAYSYGANAIVRYSGDLYLSLVGTNTALPSDATKWALLPTAARLQSAYFTSCVAGGTADALTGTFALAPTAYPAAPGTQKWLVRAGSANATTTPTFTPNSGVLAPKTIVKGNNLALAAGDIAGAGHWLELVYDATLDKWVLQNPANGIAASNLVDTLRVDIASAATVNLTTGAASTRNINITGTTSISAFTVAAGLLYFARFAASLTLTNGANIVTQTGANIVTQAGDTCILRATAANTVEVVSYVPAILNQQTTRSMVRLNTAKGYGSTNTCILRFLNTVSNQGADVTYADSATLGGSFTINAPGVYAVVFTWASTTSAVFGLSLNSTQLSMSINSINVADRISAGYQATGFPGSSPWVGFLPAGAVIRAHTDGAASGTAALSAFTITRVG